MAWKKISRLLFWRSGAGREPFAGVAGDPTRARVARVPRVAVLPLHNLTARLTGSDPAAAPLCITNISSSGLGLLRVGLTSAPEAGGRLEGVLNIEQERLPLVLRVVHISSSVVGCAFVDPSAELRAAIVRYLEVELNALDMREVGQALLKGDPEGVPHWFRGRNNCELFFVTDPEGRLVRFSAAFFGNVVEGGATEDTRFGHVVDSMDEDSEFKPGYKASALVSWRREPDADLFELAHRFLKSVNGLEPRHLSSILERVRPA